jgi:hypothetical protein
MSQESVAPAPTLEEANLFDITGPIVINYSRSSITGAPLFSYKDAEWDLNFSGAEITQVRTPVGELVTVTLEDVPDALVRTFTLIVPNIRLEMGDQLPFDTVGIEVIDRSGAHVPPPGPVGVLTVIRAHHLSGIAQVVRF